MSLGDCRVDGCEKEAVGTTEISVPIEGGEYRYDAGLCQTHLDFIEGSALEEVTMTSVTITTRLTSCRQCGHRSEFGELDFEDRESGARVGVCPVCRYECYIWLDGGTLDLGLL